MPHLWKYSRSDWMELWATWSSWRCPCSLQWGHFKGHLIVLWFREPGDLQKARHYQRKKGTDSSWRMVNRNITFLRLSSGHSPGLGREKRTTLLWKYLGEKSWWEAGLDKQVAGPQSQRIISAAAPTGLPGIPYSPARPLLYPGKGHWIQK